MWKFTRVFPPKFAHGNTRMKLEKEAEEKRKKWRNNIKKQARNKKHIRCGLRPLAVYELSNKSTYLVWFTSAPRPSRWLHCRIVGSLSQTMRLLFTVVTYLGILDSSGMSFRKFVELKFWYLNFNTSHEPWYSGSKFYNRGTSTVIVFSWRDCTRFLILEFSITHYV